MKKKSILILMVMVLIFTSSSNHKVLANKTDEDLVETKEKLTEDLTVSILKDGRVAPIKNTEELSEHKLDLILKRIGYPNDFILNKSIDKKRQLASYGGRVVEGGVSQFENEYVSSDGKSYKVTPSNENEIKNIQLEDLKKMGITGDKTKKYNLIDENKSLMSTDTGIVQDGKWSARIVASHIGETGTQKRFVVMMEYFWDKEPQVHFGDSLGMSWSPYGTPIANTAEGVHAINFGGSDNWVTMDHDLDTSSNDGIASQFGYRNDQIYGKQMGFLSEEIWIDKSYSNKYVAVSGAYIHPWIPGGWSISVLKGALSIDAPDSLGNKWTWRYNFMP